MLTPMLPFYSEFIGSSRPRRSRAAQKAHPRRYRDEESEVHVDPSMVRQAARECVAAKQENIRKLKRDEAKRMKFDSLTTLAELGTEEFVEMRVQQFYSLQRTSEDDRL